jgi:hypothetical protein
LLADLVSDWDDASAAGPEAFARQVAASDRGSGRRVPTGGNGSTHAGSPRYDPAPAGPQYGAPVADGDRPDQGRPMMAVGPGTGPVVPSTANSASRPSPAVPYVSPRRGGGVLAADLPVISPAEPIGAHVELPGGVQPPDERDEPAVPDEARARIVADATADAPVDAGPDVVLHVSFAAIGPSDRVVGAMETFKAVLRDRPGETRVVIHVPGPAGSPILPMELRRGVAYDAELLAEIRRRLGDGLVEIRLTSP